jgi:hypothetical protein
LYLGLADLRMDSMWMQNLVHCLVETDDLVLRL